MAIPGSPAFLLPPGDDEIPRKLRDIERYITELGPSIAASIKPAMDDIRANVAALAAQQVVLEAQDVVVAGLIADLAATDVTLAAQVATIAALVSEQVTGATDTASASGFSLTGTPVDVATVSVPVPAGFTIARVMAMSSLRSAGVTEVNCETIIQGNIGEYTTGLYSFAGSSHAVTLSGLSGGTVTASTRASSYPDRTGNRATTTIFVLFFR